MTSRTLTTPAQLVSSGLLPAERLSEAEQVAARYAIGVTPAMAGLIQHAADPIGLQFIPQVGELVTLPEEREDPIGDHAHSPVEGVVHRYPDRVLLKVLHVCPVYCRFCFRREMVGPSGDGTLSGNKLDAALDYIASAPEIWEVILTGGDPLMLSPRRMLEIMQRLGAMPHVRVIRFHSRVPVVDPARITPALIEALTASGRATYLAVHSNHASEITPDGEEALKRLAEAGIVLLGQTVLLKGVNDDPDVLAALMRRLVENRVTPYYLHHPDLAPGTSHFRLSIDEGRALVAGLRSRVSGLCQPTYVLDIPGGYGKTNLADALALPQADGRWTVRDRNGVDHLYPPEA